MTPTSTLNRPAHSGEKKTTSRFVNHKISTEKKHGKQKPFFPKDIRPGTLIVVE
jgi:hypothetical protein